MCATYCEHHGLRKSGKKNELMERVKTHYDSNNLDLAGGNDNRDTETLLLDAGIVDEGALDEAEELVEDN